MIAQDWQAFGQHAQVNLADRVIDLLWFRLDAVDEGDARLLSADEHARAGRFKFDIHRHRFTRARAVLRRVLAAQICASPSALSFRYGPQGKPELHDDAFAFNLSHSGDLALLAWSSQAALGVDLECHDRASDLTDLEARVFTASEQSWLSAREGLARRAGFFALWTAKEARMKVTGEGMSLPPQEIELILESDVVTGVRKPSTPVIAMQSLTPPFAACSASLAVLPR